MLSQNMPDQGGKLTEADTKHVKDWLAKHSKGGIALCPICGSPQWMIADRLVQPVTIGAGNTLMLGGEGYPQVMLISNPCGYTRFLNAVIVGLMPPLPPTDEPKKG